MTWATEQAAIAARFAAQAPVAAGRIAWDDFNGPAFTPPTVTNIATPTDYSWIRLTVRPINGSGRPMGLGPAAKNYREGLIIAQCFVPRFTGEQLAAQLVDDVRGIYHRAQFNNVRCRDTDAPVRVGLNGEWWQINVLTPYFVEELGPDTNGAGTVEDAGVKDFTQASPTLAVGDVVYPTSSTTWAKARANAAATLGKGVIVRAAGTVYSVATFGFHPLVNTFTAGAEVYLSQSTAGLLTAATPDPALGGYEQVILTAISPTLVLIHPRQAREL